MMMSRENAKKVKRRRLWRKLVTSAAANGSDKGGEKEGSSNVQNGGFDKAKEEEFEKIRLSLEAQLMCERAKCREQSTELKRVKEQLSGARENLTGLIQYSEFLERELADMGERLQIICQKLPQRKEVQTTGSSTSPWYSQLR
jgi:hypothetical protein